MGQPWNGIERRVTNLAGKPPAEERLSDLQPVFNTLLDNMPFLAWLKGHDGRYVAASLELARHLDKQHIAEIIGSTDFDLYSEALAQHYRDQDNKVMTTRSHRMIETEEYLLGQSRWMKTHVSPVISNNGTLLGTIGFAHDISEYKARERQTATEAEKQREVLVREVHHRIKNNLQSVAGLLRRELGKFIQLDPHLDKAITQVHAIAVVHGLQSTDPDEAIRLCDTVNHICMIVREQTLRPIEFHIENELTTFRPVQINRDEAVAVALILNELILNAVKHLPEQARAPQVTLDANGEHAHISIRNTQTATDAFNLDTGSGLKTGLRLVKSLLPEQGAQLSYTRDTAHLLTAHLRLTPPVVQSIFHKGTSS